MLMIFAFSQPRAAGFSVPESIAGAEIINSESLIVLAQGVGDLILFDSRLEQDRSTGFIDGSVSLSDLETSCERLRSYLSSKSQAVVFYSNGVHCLRSARAISKALDCGYTRVYWLRGGFEEWRSSDYPYMLE